MQEEKKNAQIHFLQEHFLKNKSKASPEEFGGKQFSVYCSLAAASSADQASQKEPPRAAADDAIHGSVKKPVQDTNLHYPKTGLGGTNAEDKKG